MTCIIPPLPGLRFSHTCGLLRILRESRGRIVLLPSRPPCPCPAALAQGQGGKHGWRRALRCCHALARQRLCTNPAATAPEAVLRRHGQLAWAPCMLPFPDHGDADRSLGGVLSPWICLGSTAPPTDDQCHRICHPPPAFLPWMFEHHPTLRYNRGRNAPWR